MKIFSVLLLTGAAAYAIICGVFEKVSVENEFMKKLVATIKEKIKKGETAVFLIEAAE